MLLSKAIVFFGRNSVMSCDGKCDKAWGRNNRPLVFFDVNGEVVDRNSPDLDYDNHAMLPDDLLGMAPQNPGTYEGFEGKPDMDEVHADSSKMNRWCARECERNYMNEKPRDFSTFNFNKPSIKAKASVVMVGKFKEAVEQAIAEGR